MKSLIIAIQVLIVFVLFSCQEGNSVINYGSPQDTISFDFKNDIKDPNVFFDLVDSIEVVKLQTSKDFLIAYITKILCDKDFLYILDQNAKSLFKFTKEGKFVLKLSRIGKGPGEYVKPSDFCLLDNAIAILDGGSGKVIFYDKNGQFLKEFEQKSMADKFAVIDTNYFQCSTKIERQLSQIKIFQ